MRKLFFAVGVWVGVCVGVWTILAPLVVTPLRGQSVPAELISYPETILHNGNILTVDENFSRAQALAIRGGKFLAVGTNQNILRLKGPETKVIDLAGRMVVPGFIATDADNDYVGGNLYKETLLDGKIFGTLNELRTKVAIVDKVKTLAAAHPGGEPIFLRVNEESMEALRMTRADLDPVSPKNPVAISVSSSDFIVNTAMLNLVIERIPEGEAHPGIVKDPATGKPNGQLFGQATGIVGWDLRPWPKIDDAMMQEQKDMFMDLNKLGVTSMVGHAQGFSLSVINVLYHRNELTLRVFASHDFLRQNPFAEAYLRRLGNLVDFGLGDMVQIVGAGLASADGNADVGSALTLDPKLRSGGYIFAASGENKWIGYGPHANQWSDPKLNRKLSEWQNVQVAIKYGWNTTAIHNVGDQATSIWLNSINEALDQPDVVLRPQFRPFGLDHNLFWNPQNYPLIEKLDTRQGLGKMWSGTDKAVELYGDKIHDIQPVPDLIQRGLKVHIEGNRPLEEMQQYITRRDQQGRTWGPDQAIDRPTALRMKTIWAARFIAEEKNLGSIEPGKKADLAILGADSTVPEDQIEKIPVTATVVGGKVVYGRY